MNTNIIKNNINTYLALLIITLTGAGASLLIIRVAYNNSYTFIYETTTLDYTDTVQPAHAARGVKTPTAALPDSQPGQ